MNLQIVYQQVLQHNASETLGLKVVMDGASGEASGFSFDDLICIFLLYILDNGVQ